jgi:hypothetical protein
MSVENKGCIMAGVAGLFVGHIWRVSRVIAFQKYHPNGGDHPYAIVSRYLSLGELYKRYIRRL